MNINIFESSYRLINKYNQKTKKPRTYGTEELLYPAEVHMIEIIGSYKKTTTTRLAGLLGITKGAVSQTTNKLIGKGLIEKLDSTERNNEVYIILSDSGREVFEYHRKMHADMLKKVDDVIKELSPEGIQALQKIIDIIDKSFGEI